MNKSFKILMILYICTKNNKLFLKLKYSLGKFDTKHENIRVLFISNSIDSDNEMDFRLSIKADETVQKIKN